MACGFKPSMSSGGFCMESWNRSALYQVARGSRDAVDEAPGALFLTLCSVPAPISLPEPKSPGLQRYRFFFSRQTENGSERCWLHFGYFRNLEEAQKWREVLCRVYPAAAIRTGPHSGAAQSGTASTDTLSESQVLSVLNRKPAATKVPEPVAAERRQSSLEDTLSELRDSAWGSLDGDSDEASSTGVRHLRVEVTKATVSKFRKAARKS